MFDGSFAERRRQEMAKHGQSVLLPEGHYLFEDGATLEQDPMCWPQEPPSDPHQRAKRVLLYRQVVLERATTAFRERKAFFMQAANVAMRQRFVPPPPVNADQAEAELKGLQHEVKMAQRACEEAKREVESTVPEAVRVRQQESAANRNANEHLLGKLATIEI